MSEFDQEGRKWFANPDFNPAQCNVVAAEHRESRTAAERHTGDYDCLGQLIQPRSRPADSDGGAAFPMLCSDNITLRLRGIPQG